MNVLSLFDGISCGQVALERAGIKIDKYYASEIESNSIKVTQHNYPNTIQLGDVTNWETWNIDWANIDLLIGGSPCQGFSIAGKQLNFEDPRSKLFFEFVDILNHIKAYNPNVLFFLENVPMKQEWQDIISSYLGVEPINVNSEKFSASIRERLYWSNIPIPDFDCVDNSLVLSDIMLEEDKVPSKYWYGCGFDFDTLDKPVCGRLHLNGHDFLKRVMSPKFKCQTLTAVCGGNQQKKVYQNGRCRKLTPLEYERLMTLSDNYTSCISDGARYKAIGNGWNVDTVAYFFANIYKQR